jgi:hypothetical protein
MTEAEARQRTFWKEPEPRAQVIPRRLKSLALDPLPPQPPEVTQHLTLALWGPLLDF